MKQVLTHQNAQNLQVAKSSREGISIESIAKDVCNTLELGRKDLFKKGRNNKISQARKII